MSLPSLVKIVATVQFTVAVYCTLSPAQCPNIFINCIPATENKTKSSLSPGTNSTSDAMPFQEVWRRSFCRTIERLVEVVQEYPGEVEYIYSPACVPLVRCAGCCGDENLECHPTLTSNVTMQLLKIKPAEQDQQYVVMTFVEHKSCECRLRKATVKQERRRSRGRGRKRKERQKMKDCDTCQPPRR